MIQHAFSLFVSKQTCMYLPYGRSRIERKLKMKRGRQDNTAEKKRNWRGHSFDSGFNIYLCDLPKFYMKILIFKIPSNPIFYDSFIFCIHSFLESNQAQVLCSSRVIPGSVRPIGCVLCISSCPACH